MSARPAPPPADEPAQRLNRSEWAYLACEPLAASIVDGIAKGLPNPAWPHDAWQALARLTLMLCKAVRPAL